MPGEMRSPFAQRLRRARDSLARAGLEALWVDPGVDLDYLTGLRPLSLERLAGLILPAGAEPRWLAPLLLRDEMAAAEIGPLHVWSDDQGPDRAADDALRGLGRLHVSGSMPAWALFELRRIRPDLELELDPGVVAELRARKDEAEVELLRRSARITDQVMAWVGSQPVTEMTELALAARIKAAYLERGVDPTPHPLVASGPGSAMPHYAGREVQIRPDEVLLLDFGCRVGGYWSDLTRLYFPPHPNAELEEFQGVVREAYQAAWRAIAPGAPCQEVDRAARRVIERAGYGPQFLHRTGHGLGLDVHEPPYLRQGNEQPLQVGHVFSIEPGIYLEGRFGVRYENIIHLGPEGPESLNQAAQRFRLPGREGRTLQG